MVNASLSMKKREVLYFSSYSTRKKVGVVKVEILKSTYNLPPTEANKGKRRFLGTLQTPAEGAEPLCTPPFMSGCQGDSDSHFSMVQL